MAKMGNELTRTETDYLGSVDLLASDLGGINTARGLANLTVSRRPIHREREFVKAFAQCKWAAALANRDLGMITAQQSSAIVQACKEVADGMHHEYFVIDFMEGSGGTSTNMNVNEVIANRAQQLLGGELGRYDLVHPNDHVNRSQSTNDVYPSAMKIAAYALLAPLIEELHRLAASFSAKARAFEAILHLGRTCMQDAQPMTLGQPFLGYASLTRRLGEELSKVRDYLLTLPLGGTAIGTGFGAPKGYKSSVFSHLEQITGIGYLAAQDPFDAMQNLDSFCRISGELRTCATSLAKVASDLILLSSGPHGGIAEIELPAVQAGSSIMPGKINPVIPMSMVQVGFAVVGNDVCIAQANQAGQLEINHFEPIVADRLYDSIGLLSNAVRLFREKCINGIRANLANNERHLLQSTALATALIPQLGYAQVSTIVRECATAHQSLLEGLQERGILSKSEAMVLVAQSTLTV